MMRLVVEQVCKHMAATLALHMVKARHVDPGLERRRIEPIAQCDQAQIAGALLSLPLCDIGAGLERVVLPCENKTTVLAEIIRPFRLISSWPENFMNIMSALVTRMKNRFPTMLSAQMCRALGVNEEGS